MHARGYICILCSVRGLKACYSSNNAMAFVYDNRECKTVLTKEAQAPLIGHMLSTLLATAEAELKRGPTGSRALTKQCIEAVNSVVGVLSSDAESLAFFVPGLVQGASTLLVP